METTTDGRGGEELHPEAQLAMLESVQDATEAKAWMPSTPVWHAPILATAIAGLALLYSGPGNWAVVGAIVGGIATVFGLVDQVRRQRVSPRRLKKPTRLLAFYGFILVVVSGIVAIWVRIELPDRAGQAAVVVIGAWLATAIVFALGITFTNRLGDRWTESQR